MPQKGFANPHVLTVIERVRAISGAIGSARLAIASGITLENVVKYMPFAKYFIVGTGISNPSTDENDDLPGDLIPDLVRQLVAILRKGV